MKKPSKNISETERNRRRKISDAVRESWNDVVIRQRREIGLRRVANDPERCRKIREHHPRHWLGTKGARFGQKHKDDSKKRIAESLSNWRKRLQENPVASLQWAERQKLAHTGHRASIATRRKISRAGRLRYGTLGKRRVRRESLKYLIWKQRVVKRDGKICSICKATGKDARLEIDHIKPWALFPKLRYDANNGRVLCRACHLKYGWRRGHLEG